MAISFVTPEQGGQLTDIEMTINKLIESDSIEGFTAYTPRVKFDIEQPPPVYDIAHAASSRDDDGWGLEEEAPAAPKDEKKGVFGKNKRKYSNRL